MERTEIIKGLRELADWLEDTPEAIMTSGSIVISEWAYNKEGIIALAKTPGTFEKVYEGGYFDLRRHFSGNIRYQMSSPRRVVCEARVVGTRKVEHRDPELVALVPMIEKDEDIVEWDCIPLLAPSTDDE